MGPGTKCRDDSLGCGKAGSKKRLQNRPAPFETRAAAAFQHKSGVHNHDDLTLRRPRVRRSGPSPASGRLEGWAARTAGAAVPACDGRLDPEVAHASRRGLRPLLSMRAAFITSTTSP
jgi:hypothetical protein